MTLKVLLVLIFSTCLASADYDPTQALEYAYASALSHCAPNSILSWTCGAACVNLTGYQGYYAEVVNIPLDQSLAYAMIVNPTAKKFVTTFRGTVGDLQLLLEVLESDPVPYELSNIADAKCTGYFYNHYVKDLRNSVIEHLTAAYQQYPDYEFVITGHSLGGALATLTAFDVIISGLIPREQVIMYNYGSPRVGNQAFVKAVEATIPVMYRVVHWKDIVSHVPPCERKGGVCIPTMETENIFAMWPAWHLSPQVFYEEDGVHYKICDGDEDPKCSDQFEMIQTDPADHDYYLNVYIDCDGSSVFKEKPTKEIVLDLVLRGKLRVENWSRLFDEILQ